MSPNVTISRKFVTYYFNGLLFASLMFAVVNIRRLEIKYKILGCFPWLSASFVFFESKKIFKEQNSWSSLSAGYSQEYRGKPVFIFHYTEQAYTPYGPRAKFDLQRLSIWPTKPKNMCILFGFSLKHLNITNLAHKYSIDIFLACRII